MKKVLATVLIIQLVSLAPLMAFAAEKPQDVRAGAADRVESAQRSASGETAVIRAEDSSLADKDRVRSEISLTKTPAMLEIEALQEAERAQLAELRVRLQAAPDEAAALAVQREARQLKRETELEILRIQIRSANEMGRLDTVERLEAAIEYLTNPRPVTPPAERARPSAPQR